MKSLPFYIPQPENDNPFGQSLPDGSPLQGVSPPPPFERQLRRLNAGCHERQPKLNGSLKVYAIVCTQVTRRQNKSFNSSRRVRQTAKSSQQLFTKGGIIVRFVGGPRSATSVCPYYLGPNRTLSFILLIRPCLKFKHSLRSILYNKECQNCRDYNYQRIKNTLYDDVMLYSLLSCFRNEHFGDEISATENMANANGFTISETEKSPITGYIRK